VKYSFWIGLVFMAVLDFPLAGCRSKPLSHLSAGLHRLVGCFESAGESTGLNSDGPVIARVGDATITVSDYRAYVERMSAANGENYNTPESRRHLLDFLINRKVVAASARQLGLDRDANYRRSLANSADNLLREPLLAHLGTVTDDEIGTYYNLHKTEFEPPVQFQVSRFLFKTPSEAKKFQALLKSGHPMADSAPQPARQVFIKGHMDPELEKVLLALPKGRLSRLRKVPMGYEILRKDGEMKGPAVPYETAKMQIKNALEFTKLDAWTQKARSSMTVEVDDRAMASLSIPSTTGN
jgi:hypothetical protein